MSIGRFERESKFAKPYLEREEARMARCSYNSLFPGDEYLLDIAALIFRVNKFVRYSKAHISTP